jgi:hypothetical protein
MLFRPIIEYFEEIYLIEQKIVETPAKRRDGASVFICGKKGLL